MTFFLSFFLFFFSTFAPFLFLTHFRCLFTAKSRQRRCFQLMFILGWVEHVPFNFVSLLTIMWVLSTGGPPVVARGTITMDKSHILSHLESCQKHLSPCQLTKNDVVFLPSTASCFVGCSSESSSKGKANTCWGGCQPLFLKTSSWLAKETHHCSSWPCDSELRNKQVEKMNERMSVWLLWDVEAQRDTWSLTEENLRLSIFLVSLCPQQTPQQSHTALCRTKGKWHYINTVSPQTHTCACAHTHTHTPPDASQ